MPAPLTPHLLTETRAGATATTKYVRRVVLRLDPMFVMACGIRPTSGQSCATPIDREFLGFLPESATVRNAREGVADCGAPPGGQLSFGNPRDSPVASVPFQDVTQWTRPALEPAALSTGYTAEGIAFCATRLLGMKNRGNDTREH